eukprot:COSAG04_NODE_159_length_22103_cov_21.289389_9_plen_192_part_00
MACRTMKPQEPKTTLLPSLGSRRRRRRRRRRRGDAAARRRGAARHGYGHNGKVLENDRDMAGFGCYFTWSAAVFLPDMLDSLRAAVRQAGDDATAPTDMLDALAEPWRLVAGHKRLCSAATAGCGDHCRLRGRAAPPTPTGAEPALAPSPGPPGCQGMCTSIQHMGACAVHRPSSSGRGGRSDSESESRVS